MTGEETRTSRFMRNVQSVSTIVAIAALCSIPPRLTLCQVVPSSSSPLSQAPSIDSIVAHTAAAVGPERANLNGRETQGGAATPTNPSSTETSDSGGATTPPAHDEDASAFSTLDVDAAIAGNQREKQDVLPPPKDSTQINPIETTTRKIGTSEEAKEAAAPKHHKTLRISKIVMKVNKGAHHPPEDRGDIINNPVPALPPSYDLSLDMTDMRHNENFRVQEMENGGRARHSLWGNNLNVTCIFNSLTEEGFLVEGVKCGRYSGLPKRCFCTSKFCRSYVTTAAILQFLRSHNASFSKEVLSGEGKVELWSWKVSIYHMDVEAVYSTSINHPEALQSTPPSYHLLAPLSFTVKGTGKAFMLPGGPIWLQYRVRGWSLKAETTQELVSTPPGVVCPAYERKYMPKLSNQFSLTMETVIENLRTIAYERQNYEVDEKIVSFTYNPHLHADGMFLLNIPGLNDLSLEVYRVVHDFKTGIQYMINEKTCNCTIQGIPISALDAAPMENRHVRLKHASELISIHPKLFIYKGTRSVRGVLCDVWVAERGVIQGRYSTVEVFFSHENWTVEIEIFNKVRQVPIGISSYVANADSPTQWTSVVHTFFYEYSDSHLSWDKFDISPCLSRINRIFIILTLEVSYAELVHYNLELAKNSIRRAVAGIAGVSPLRITDLFLSSRATTGEVDVWFVLLEKPDMVGPVLNPRPQLLMAEAYKLLHDITHNHNVSVKLELSPTKKLFVTIKRGSVETSTQALHPHFRHKSMRFLKAGYTAGSVAGLGFSMAILGTCVGIFVGFLLWKRSPSIPYKVTM